MSNGRSPVLTPCRWPALRVRGSALTHLFAVATYRFGEAGCCFLLPGGFLSAWRLAGSW